MTRNPPVKVEPALVDDVRNAAQILAAADTLFLFTGSGMSAESGIPTFRGPEGLWRGVRAEDVATLDGFVRDPAFVWQWYKERILAHAKAKPNAGHRALAKLQRLYGRQTLATQNVDLFHERGGSRGVLHLHGRLSHVRCMACRRSFELTKKLLRAVPPRCGECEGLLRPDVVWFGEVLPEAAFREASAAAASADACLVVGTSNLVHPAASLPLISKKSGARLVEVNPEPTPLTSSADVHIEGPAGKILPPLYNEVARLRRQRTQN